jgi:hypothetical protein
MILVRTTINCDVTVSRHLRHPKMALLSILNRDSYFKAVEYKLATSGMNHSESEILCQVS